MDRSVLAARIQDILKGRTTPSRPEGAPVPPPNPAEAGFHEERQPTTRPEAGFHEVDEEAAFAARCAADEAAADASNVLGGEVIEGPGGRCLVVDRRYGASHVHGRDPVERFASAAAASLHALPWFLGQADDDARLELAGLRQPSRLLFFDLETTGLSGGAGTCAFLVGCAFFDGAELATRQFFLRGYGEERALLETVRGFIGDEAQSCLVTYNGRAFDLPLDRDTLPVPPARVAVCLPASRRHAVRRPPPLEAAPVPAAAVDLSITLRWTLPTSGPAAPSRPSSRTSWGWSDCDDVPGWEIPARYFAYTRTRDARGLVAVLEHNRLDLLSLAAITALVFEMVVCRDHAARRRPDCLALARLLDYLHRNEDAARCYERAAEPDGLIEGEFDRAARAEALHWLALHRRRARRFVEAADAWRQLLSVPGLHAELRREACEALAVHHEHRAKDLEAARGFALRALDVARAGRHAPEVQHRLERLSRKLRDRRPGDDILPAQGTFPVEG